MGVVGEHDWLAERFEEQRRHLRAVAYRMLGSVNEADDAVQEAWLRLSRSDVTEVRNLGGWLTTVVGRVCLDMLRARRARREEPFDTHGVEHVAGREVGSDPEHEAELTDSVGLALLVVLDALAPGERVAFVLHDMFGVPFDDIAPIVGRSPAAARQLASRARRRVQGVASVPGADLPRRREIVEAFLAASRGGDFEALLALLDPDVVLRADGVAVLASMAGQKAGAPQLATEVRGAGAVAGTFSGRAGAARPALVAGAVGAAWAPGGRPRAVFSFLVRDGRIVAIDVIADQKRIRQLGVTVLDD